MTNFNFYNAAKAYGELYLQFPKVFLYSDKYKDLSNDAKIAYMVFKDRLQYSIQNNWIDEAGHVYFIYTVQQLMTLLNTGKNKTINIKKELEEKGLLLQVQQGFNPKKKKNEPNRLYLADLDVEAYEVYAFQNLENHLQNDTETLDNSGSLKIKPRLSKGKTLDNSGSLKIKPRLSKGKTLDNSGSLKIKPNQYKYNNYKDNKDNKDQEEFQQQIIQQQFSKHDKANESEIIETYIQENQLELAYGEKTIQLLKAYSFNDFDKFKVFADKFYYGLKSAEKEIDYTINPYKEEFLHEQLESTFKRVIVQFKQGKAKDINSYLYISLKNVFLDFGNHKKNTTTNIY